METKKEIRNYCKNKLNALVRDHNHYNKVKYKDAVEDYFSRNSSAYDSLMQMCRWFGYRHNYEDLCRVYISPINIMNFRAVIDAVEDLKTQFREMALRKMKPADFGLMVKESPDTLNTSLMITSRNKMYNTGEIIRVLNYGGTYADTSKIFPDTASNEKNINATTKFFESVNSSGIKWEDVPVPKGTAYRHMLRNVSKSLVAKFVRKLRIPYENSKFDVDSLADYIEKSEVFQLWDVVVASGSTGEYDSFEGQPLVSRSFRKRDDSEVIRIGDKNNRLIEPGIFNSGLTEAQLQRVNDYANERIKNTGKDVFSGYTVTDYLSIEDRKPLLAIYPIRLKLGSVPSPAEKRVVEELKSLPCILGFAVGFPKKENAERLKYRANKVKIRAIEQEREEPEGDEDDYED